MSDIFDQNIAVLHITKEVLDKLGITDDVKKTPSGVGTREPEGRINEYAKYFRQLWKTIQQPSRE